MVCVLMARLFKHVIATGNSLGVAMLSGADLGFQEGGSTIICTRKARVQNVGHAP